MDELKKAQKHIQMELTFVIEKFRHNDDCKADMMELERLIAALDDGCVTHPHWIILHLKKLESLYAK